MKIKTAKLGYAVWFGVALLAASTVLLAGGSRRDNTRDEKRGWYRLVSLVPGERVPEWLHTGKTYPGRPVSGGQGVELSEPDSGKKVVVNASLLAEVPLTEV